MLEAKPDPTQHRLRGLGSGNLSLWFRVVLHRTVNVVGSLVISHHTDLSSVVIDLVVHPLQSVGARCGQM